MMRRGTLVVVLLLVFVAMASFAVFLAGPDDDAPAPPPTQNTPTAASPSKGVRVGGGRRRSADETTPDTKVPGAPRARLLVRVQGAGGPREPLAGAAVYVMDASGSDWRAVTAGAGTARFDELPAGRTVVHTEVAGKKVSDRTLDLKSDEEQTLDVVAMRVGTVRGIVRDPDGRPVDTAWVHLDSGGSRDVLTGDDGGFEIADAPWGQTFTLTAGAPGWADSAPVEGVRLEGDPPSATCDVVLRRMSSLVVRVSDPSGAPTDARIAIDGSAASIDRRSAGEYVRNCLQPGDHTVAIAAKGFREARQSVTVGDGGVTTIEMRLDEGVAIEGVVVDENGNAVADATVITGLAAGANAEALAWRASRMGRGGESMLQTAADGTFRIEHLSADDYALSAATETLASEAFTMVRAPASGIRVPVVGIARVRFRVVREGGFGNVESLRVSECAAGARPNRACRDMRTVVLTRSPASGVSITVTRSARALLICGDDYAPVVVAFTPVPGRTVDLGDVHVNAGLSLKGRVVATDGSPVGGVQVYASLAFGATRQCVARDDGTFVLEHLASGPVIVRAAKAGLMGVAVLEVGRDAPKPELVVRTVGVLDGIVRDGRGAAVARADVRVRYGFADADDEAGTWQDVKTGHDGRFATTVIAGRCLASAGGASVRADVAEGGKATVTLEKP